MKVLVTGGLGFIGSTIVDKLVAAGHEVAIADNLSTGKRENLNPAATLYEVDILSDAFRDVYQQAAPEVVYHMAAQIDIQKSIRDTAHDATVNILGTIRVLECMRDFGARKIIYASSAAVYGEPHYLPVDEEHPNTPISFYGISKYTPEHYIRVYAGMHGFSYTILRFANAYGIRQDPKGEGGVVSIFVDKLLTGQTPIIFGDGEQTRDFVYVADIAEACVRAAHKGDGKIINVSTNTQTSVNQLLAVMEEALGVDIPAEYRPARAADIVDNYMDNTRLRELLGFVPAYDINRGLSETIAYYKKQYQK